MEFRIWELGILLAGIGFFILCLNLAFTIKNLNSTVKKVDLLVDNNTNDIGDIIENVAGITSAVDEILVGVTKIIGVVSGIKIISSLGKSKDSRRD